MRVGTANFFRDFTSSYKAHHRAVTRIAAVISRRILASVKQGLRRKKPAAVSGEVQNDQSEPCSGGTGLAMSSLSSPGRAGSLRTLSHSTSSSWPRLLLAAAIPFCVRFTEASEVLVGREVHHVFVARCIKVFGLLADAICFQAQAIFAHFSSRAETCSVLKNHSE